MLSKFPLLWKECVNFVRNLQTVVKSSLFLSFLLGLFLASCSPETQSVTTMGASFENIRYLKIKGDFCEVSVEVSDTESLSYSAIMEQLKSGSGLRVRNQEKDGVLKVWVEKPLATIGNVAGKLRFTVPPNTRIKVESETGDIYIDGVAGEKVKVRTNSGDIFLSKLNTEISAKSVSGDIEINGQIGEAKVKSASGDVQIRKLKGDLKAITTSGDINLNELKGRLRLEAGSGEIKGSGILVTGHSNVETYSGNVKFRMNNEPDALHLQLFSSSGNIISGDSLTRKSFNNQQGDWSLVVNTKLGDITVH